MWRGADGSSAPAVVVVGSGVGSSTMDDTGCTAAAGRFGDANGG